MKTTIKTTAQASDTISSIALRSEAIASLSRGWEPEYERRGSGDEMVEALEVEGGWLRSDNGGLNCTRPNQPEVFSAALDDEQPTPATTKTSKKIVFTVWGKSAQKLSLGNESAMMKLDGVDTKPQAVGRRIERLTGLDVVNMRQDSQEQRGGEIVSTTYEITLGRTLYRRGLDGKRQSDGCSVEGELWCSIPRG